MNKMKEDDFYYDWRNNDLKLFYKNYKSNNEFLNNFFKYYKRIKKYDMDDLTKNNLENKFLKIIIELEDEYILIKYMKKYNLDYKKLFKEFSIG